MIYIAQAHVGSLEKHQEHKLVQMGSGLPPSGSVGVLPCGSTVVLHSVGARVSSLEHMIV